MNVHLNIRFAVLKGLNLNNPVRSAGGKNARSNRSPEGAEYTSVNIHPFQGCGHCSLLSVRFTHGYSNSAPHGAIKTQVIPSDVRFKNRGGISSFGYSKHHSTLFT